MVGIVGQNWEINFFKEYTEKGQPSLLPSVYNQTAEVMPGTNLDAGLKELRAQMMHVV